MPKNGINRTISIAQPNVFGRVGTAIGRGISEQLPKEIERTRLASGLKELGEKQNLTPFQQFARLASTPGVNPQIVQSGTDLLRQQSIIDSIKEQNSQGQPDNNYRPFTQDNTIPSSATTTESTEAALNPYIPPSGPEQENMARRLMAAEPRIYTNIDSARAAIANQVAGNVQQSNSRLQKRNLEEDVQNKAETSLRNEIGTVGAQIPGTVLSNLQQKAVDDVRTKKLTPDQAKVKYGKKADSISKSFSNIRSWGNLGLITKSPKDLISSISTLQKNSKENGYQKEAADSLIAENGLTPQFAYATMYPVSDIKSLNEQIKSLKDIRPRIEKVPGVPGLAGLGRSRPNNVNSSKLTSEIVPSLARSMSPEGSPLSISYELEKKGYDPVIWKQYLLDNKKQLNLTSNQIDELEKPQPSFFGWLNDWWLKSFSGVK